MDNDAPIRVCPAFKLYWVENGKVVSIKRSDHDKPYILPQEVFDIVKRVYANFKTDEHVVKYKDEDGDLINLSATDNLSFQFDKSFTQFYIYIFTSKEDAINFVLPCSGVAMRDSHEHQLCDTPRQASPGKGNINTTESCPNNTPGTSTGTSSGTNGTNGTAMTQTPNLSSIENRMETAYKLVLTSASGNFHKHVYCNGCLGGVPSNRYKCLECPNFDLCARCESKGVHPEHLIVRVSQTFVHTHKHNLHDICDAIYMMAAKRRK